ncbi:MAG: hypothetical protein WCE62_16180 [Polyangiales bacterium]
MHQHFPVVSESARPECAALTAEPLLYRFEAQLDSSPIGLVPEGLLMANAFEGRVTEGLLEGARVWGVDHLLVRSDGVGVIDAPKTISLGDRHVFEHVRGYCVPPPDLAMPPLQTVLSPEFVWPDVPFVVRATSTFRTADPGLAHLRSAIARIDGQVWFCTGRLVVETRLVSGVGVERDG